MSNIPKIVHYVFGMREQVAPFHLLHYLAIESCLQTIHPKKIYLYYHHLPYGVFWDMIRPHLTLVRVPPAKEVTSAVYDEKLVPVRYRYAHHADVIRLDALIEHGGIYADIDALFLRPIPDDLYAHPFVISREAPVRDELSGEMRKSLCNAVMMAEPGSLFAREWRARIGAALNSTWSNHSCLLAQELSEQLASSVHIEPPESFLGIPLTVAALTAMLEGSELDLGRSYSVHLWQHVWWEQERTDFSKVHAGDLTLQYLRDGNTPLCNIVKPFLPDLDLAALGPPAG